MAKPARGLPDGFALDLPDDRPVDIGDFLDEPPPVHIARKPARPETPTVPKNFESQFRPEIVTTKEEHAVEDIPASRLVQHVQPVQQPSVIRKQLNLTPKSKTMLEDLVKHIQTYSPQNDAKISEVFQGIMHLLYNALDEMELAELPKRGAWGSVTAKNFPVALSEAFEGAIVRAARKRGV